MPFRFDRRLTGLVLTLAVLVAFAACGKKRAPVLATTPGGSGAAAPPETTERTPVQPLEEGPDVRAMQGDGAEGTDIAGGALGTGEGGPLADIHFDYDSAALSDEARAILEKHALWLQGHRDVKVTVEGQCDERGTVEYNLALGEQRARAARDYLVSLGVSADRIQSVSKGKESPFCSEEAESCWSQNRRGHFIISAK